MRQLQRAVIAVLVATSLAQPAGAQVVFDGGAPTGLGGQPISSIYTLQGFSLGATTTFNAVRFWGLTDNAGDAPFTGSLTWALYSRNSSQLGSQIGTGMAAPTSQLRQIDAFATALGFQDSYQYDFGVATRTLAAGDYFLALSMAPVGMR